MLYKDNNDDNNNHNDQMEYLYILREYQDESKNSQGNAESGGAEHLFENRSEFDVVCLVLQESTYPNIDCMQIETKKFSSYVGDEYYMVQHCQRAQLQLFLFAKKLLKDSISNVEQSVENTGFLHLFPNKGGLLVTMQVHGTKLAFISCHLAAHEGVKHCEARNQSIIEILGGVRAGDKTFDVAEQYHHVFWMGDMNYRTTIDPAAPSLMKKNAHSYELPIAKFKTLPASLNTEECTDGEAATSAVSAEDVNPQLHGEGEDAEELTDSDGDDPHDPAKAEKKRARKVLYKSVADMICAEQWGEILALDELNREITSGRVLNRFIPLQSHWPPTFNRTRHLIINRTDGTTEGGTSTSPKGHMSGSFNTNPGVRRVSAHGQHQLLEYSLVNPPTHKRASLKGGEKEGEGGDTSKRVSLKVGEGKKTSEKNSEKPRFLKNLGF